MSDVVWVAIIGVAGTLIAAFFAPWIKDVVDRRAAERARNRIAIAKIIRRISSLFAELQTTSRHSPRTREIYASLEKQYVYLELLIGKGESPLITMMLVAGVWSGQSDHDPDWNKVSSETTNHARRVLASWYRGETKVTPDMSSRHQAYVSERWEAYRLQRQESESEVGDDAGR